MAKLSISNTGVTGPFKNKIINGDFNIWQRGTSFPSIISGYYFADRFKYLKNNTVVHDVSRDTDVPLSISTNYSLKFDCTTANASLGTTQYSLIRQKIEGYNFLPMVGKTCTLSFWVKATKTGTYCISFQNYIADRTYISEYTISSSNTWELKEITLTFDYSGGTWDYINGTGLIITWTLCNGSVFVTTANAWQNGNYLATSNQVNACDSTDNNFMLSQVQFEIGSAATTFESRSIGQELALCQRYFYKLTTYKYINRGYGSEGYLNLIFPVTMRATPTASYTLIADADHLATSIDGVHGYVTDDWTGTVTLNAGATYDAEL